MSAHSPSPADLAKEELRARAARIARLRGRVAAVALTTFAVAFGAIAYDGSMGAETSASTQQAVVTSSSSTTTTTSSSSSSSSSQDSTDSTDDSSSSSSDDSSAGSTVTTHQS